MPMLTFAVLLIVGPVSLVPGLPVTRTLPTRGVQTFTIAVAAGQFVHGIVDQGETDLTVSVRAPDGGQIVRFDQWDRGAEQIAFTATVAGSYTFEIRAVQPLVRAATFAVRIELPRSPAASDDRRVAATALATEGKALFAVKDEVSLRASIDRRSRALAEWRALGDSRGAELYCLIGIGDALRRLTEFGAAEAAYREALTLAADDPRSRAELLNALGVIEWSPKGDVVNARRLLEEAAALWDELRFDYGRAATLTNLAILAWEAGALDEAARQNTRAMRLFRALRDVHGEAFVLGNMAIVTDTLGRSREAIAQLSTAVRLFRQVNDRPSEGRALVRLARMQLASGFRAAAIASVQRSLPLVRQSGERLAEADALETLGRAYSDAGDPAAASAAYDEALERYEELFNRRGQSNVWHGRGVLALAAGDGATGLSALERARDLRRQIGVRSLEADTLGKMVRAARLLGDLERANEYAGDAVAIIEHVRANIFERELRRSYGSAVEQFYAQQVDVLARLHRARPAGGYGHLAWEAADRAKGRSLLERLRQAWAGPASVAGGVLVRRERDLRSQVTAAAWALWAAGEKRVGAAETASLERRLDRLLAELERVEAEIRRTEPAYAAALDAPGVDLRALQSRLDGESVVLEYALSDTDGNRVFVVTAEAVGIVDIPDARSDIERAARELAALVRTPADNEREVQAASRQVSRMLLEPVAGWLNRRKVLLVVDGVLGAVPWPAVTMPGTANTPFADDHEILTASSAASAILIDRQLAERPAAPPSIAIIADPVYSADDRVRRASASHPRDTAGFTRLAFSRDEQAGIVAALPDGVRPLVAVDFDASRSLFVGGTLRSYRYIQLAVHATSEAAQGTERRAPLSALVFSLVDRQGRPTDGFVRTYEIPRMTLTADLVVLSACSTALGFSGMSLLSQSLLAAGARGILASQFDVDDRATAFLMSRLYTYLFADPSRSPAAALRLAQADMRRSRAYWHPSHWAGWVLTGANW